MRHHRTVDEPPFTRSVDGATGAYKAERFSTFSYPLREPLYANVRTGLEQRPGRSRVSGSAGGCASPLLRALLSRTLGLARPSSSPLSNGAAQRTSGGLCACCPSGTASSYTPPCYYQAYIGRFRAKRLAKTQGKCMRYTTRVNTRCSSSDLKPYRIPFGWYTIKPYGGTCAESNLS